MDSNPYWTASGRFVKEAGSMTYRAALPAAQRLVIEVRDLDATADSASLGLMAWTASPDGQVFTAHQRAHQVAQTTLQADQAETLQLWIAGPADHAYAVTVWPVPVDDHGDSPGSATLLALGDQVTGFIDAGGDRDFFVFDLAANQVARFSLEGSESPLLILDPQGNSRWGYAGDLIQAAEAPGRYILILGSEPGHEGPYHLHTEVLVDDHANTPANATTLDIGMPLGGRLDATGDIDAFAVELQAGQRYEIHGTGLGVPGVSLAAFDAATSQWLAVARPTPEGDAIAWIEKPDGGRVELLVQNFGELTGASYALSLSVIAEDDHGDSPSTATVLNFGQPVTGRWTNAADQDIFMLDVQAGQRLQIVLQGEGGMISADTQLWLESDAQLASNAPWWSSEAPAAQRIATWQAEADGKLMLHTITDIPAAYSLRVDLRAPDDHGDLASSATSLSLGQPVTGSIQAVRDVDCFSFEALAGHRLTYSLEVAEGSIWDALLVWVEDPSGVCMSNLPQTNGNAAKTFSGHFETSQDGRATLHVDARGSLDRSYTLTVWQDEALSTFHGTLDAGWLSLIDTTPLMGLVTFEQPPAGAADWP